MRVAFLVAKLGEGALLLKAKYFFDP